ncbi:metal ABC transporter ATP-binding protein [Burkholderia multivorans]|uniref:ABC transporter ATP-binding protein n=1 Tax=Burkholderia multivorans TaxID=87883 RepID=A0AB37APN2_9BURK|nr:metal ABC transporter ATP-binding protein [Burkholderia multivorans]PRE45455.1 ABC transporter ATP-binding protein [Burkholderia multivorans]PRE52143.1 ABC transporter ATP-binding protein [Burkholderia multivorans]
MCHGSEVLGVEGLSVSFPGRTVLHEVGFTVQAGEFCGLIGSNGSGKTTLLRTILGLRKPDAGRVRIGAADGRASIGYVPQKILLDPYLPLRARDLVSLGLDGRRIGLVLPSRRRRLEVDATLQAVQAQTFADQRMGDLSGGQQQRVLIAHALIRRPRLLLLDEPLANLDVRSVAGIVALLHRLCVEQGIAVLLSAHDMNPLLPVMDRIVYLANGHAASGVTEEVVRSEVLGRLYGYQIDVVRVHGRVLVIAAGAPDDSRTGHPHDTVPMAQDS